MYIIKGDNIKVPLMPMIQCKRHHRHYKAHFMSSFSQPMDPSPLSRGPTILFCCVLATPCFLHSFFQINMINTLQALNVGGVIVGLESMRMFNFITYFQNVFLFGLSSHC